VSLAVELIEVAPGRRRAARMSAREPVRWRPEPAAPGSRSARNASGSTPALEKPLPGCRGPIMRRWPRGRALPVGSREVNPLGAATARPPVSPRAHRIPCGASVPGIRSIRARVKSDRTFVQVHSALSARTATNPCKGAQKTPRDRGGWAPVAVSHATVQSLTVPGPRATLSLPALLAATSLQQSAQEAQHVSGQQGPGSRPDVAASLSGRGMIGRMTRNLAAYVRHAEQYGGLRDCWEAAADELGAVELGELTAALRGLGSRERRAGRKGRTVTVERFRLTRDETAELIGRLIEEGIGDVDVCRCAGAAQSMVGAIRDELADRRGSAEPGCSPQPASRNGARSATDPPTSATGAVSAPAAALRSHGSRCCQWCSAPLAATLRGDARYCIGGRCKQAAHRARQAPITRRPRDRSRPSGYDGTT
jgi:hypothetical protein